MKHDLHVYVSKEEAAALKVLFPARSLSPFLREIIQSVITDAPIPEDLPADAISQILRTKAKIAAMKKEQERQEFLKSELFRFFKLKRIPVIYARNGEQTAKRICNELIPVFREQGHLLPDCFVKPLIREYLRYAVESGEVAEQYKEIKNGAEA